MKEVISTQQRINQLRASIPEMEKELEEMIAYKNRLPRLSLEDHEDVSDNYQAHLELNAEIPCLRDSIAECKRELQELESAE